MTGNYIDLNDFAEFIKINSDKFGNSEKAKLEEVFYLCINKEFNNEIKIIREKITSWFPELEIPASSLMEAISVLGMIRQSNYYPQYKIEVLRIIDNFKLIPIMYWKDYKIDTFESFTQYQEEITETAINKELYEMVNSIYLLDSIILLNKPISLEESRDFDWWLPFVGYKEDEEQHIIEMVEEDGFVDLVIHFPPHLNLKEMQELLKKNYEEINRVRSEKLAFIPRKDSRKEDLLKIVKAYDLHQKGKNEDFICIELERYLTKQKKGDGLLANAVKQTIVRATMESNARFKSK